MKQTGEGGNFGDDSNPPFTASQDVRVYTEKNHTHTGVTRETREQSSRNVQGGILPLIYNLHVHYCHLSSLGLSFRLYNPTYARSCPVKSSAQVEMLQNLKISLHNPIH